MNKQILTYIAKNLFYVLFCEAVYFHFYIELFYINVKTVYCIQRAFRCILRVNFALMHLCSANIVINVAFDLIHFIFMVIEIRIRIYISCFFLSHILFSFTLKKYWVWVHMKIENIRFKYKNSYFYWKSMNQN